MGHAGATLVSMRGGAFFSNIFDGFFVFLSVQFGRLLVVASESWGKTILIVLVIGVLALIIFEYFQNRKP
jgi:hypothetical protein